MYKKRILSFFLAGIITLSSFSTTSMALSKSDRDYIRELAKEKAANDYNVEYNSLIIVNENSLTSDGLCASGLVGATNGLFMPINEDILSAKKLDDSIKNGKENIKNAYIIGGTKVISDKFKTELEDLGYNCKRLEGKDRVETSFKIADEINELTEVEEYAVARAYKGDADAVNIAFQSRHRKMPIVLSKDGKTLNYDTKGKTVYAIGGTAVLSDSLVKNLNAKRLAGKDRFRTNEAIIKHFKETNICPVDGINERLGIAIMASNYGYEQPVLITENSYKGMFIGRHFSSAYFPNEKRSMTLSNLAVHARYGTDKYLDTLHKKTKVKKYDYIFGREEYPITPMRNSKHIKDLEKNYYPFGLYKVVDYKAYWGVDENDENRSYYLINKKNGKVYKYDKKKDAIKLI